MKVSDKGIAFLVAHEGIVPGPYLDSVGVWTYGIGHTAAAGRPIPDRLARGVPGDLDAELVEVFEVFRRDLEVYSRAVERAVKIPMQQHEFDAAVSFHYNTGAIGRASWVKHWNAGDKAAAGRAIMNWRKPKEIIPRRKDERDLFLHGQYKNKRATVWHVSRSGRVDFGRPLRTLTQDQVISMMRVDNAKSAPLIKPAPAPSPTPERGLAAILRAVFAALFGKGRT